jgi:FtsP/CotA-like multicopper oxidase with cupredoxin domain
MNRRHFLMTGSALAVLPRTGFAAPPFLLRAEPVTAQILPEGDGVTDMLGFNGSTPGPELRARQGDTLRVTFENGIDQDSAVHWHGIRLNNAMDGVPGMTQPPVQPDTRFDYAFEVPDAGTYWYHSHNRSWEQVARGLYGPLIIEEETPPDVDHDITVMIDDWRLTETGEQMGGYENLHDWSHAGRLGNFARAVFDEAVSLRTGDRVRLRLINVATARVFPIEVTGVEGKIVALDGMPLTEPEDFGQITLAPAQRMDIIADVTAQDGVGFNFMTRQGPYDLGIIAVAENNPAPRTAAIAALSPNRIAPPDIENAVALDLRMEGGAMSSVATREAIWLFNGQSGMSDDPYYTFERGQTARITLHNDTRFAHGIHLHGHHFHEVQTDGSLGHYRDTTLIAPDETRDILCVFDNPGKWLMHCHMLGHQAAGMKTWVKVL